MAGSPHSASAQETDTLRVPHIEHPALEGHEILLGPPLVVAYELGSLGKLVAVEAQRVELVMRTLCTEPPKHCATGYPPLW